MTQILEEQNMSKILELVAGKWRWLRKAVVVCKCICGSGMESECANAEVEMDRLD